LENPYATGFTRGDMDQQTKTKRERVNSSLIL
jgi:hypothetical protein